MIYEARCKKCGETFNPTPSTEVINGLGEHVTWILTRDDLEHGMNNDQTEVCYGEGELLGSWG